MVDNEVVKYDLLDHLLTGFDREFWVKDVAYIDVAPKPVLNVVTHVIWVVNILVKSVVLVCCDDIHCVLFTNEVHYLVFDESWDTNNLY